MSLNQNDLRVDWKLLNSIEGQLPIIFKLHSYRPGNIILEQDTAHPDHILIKNNAEVATYKGSYNVLFSFLPLLFPLSRFLGMNLGVLDYSERLVQIKWYLFDVNQSIKIYNKHSRTDVMLSSDIIWGWHIGIELVDV